jgi:threonine dehydratase
MVPRKRADQAEFPERPMALGNFLKGLRKDLTITMFHYRNHGAGELANCLRSAGVTGLS